MLHLAFMSALWSTFRPHIKAELRKNLEKIKTKVISAVIKAISQRTILFVLHVRELSSGPGNIQKLLHNAEPMAIRFLKKPLRRGC